MVRRVYPQSAVIPWRRRGRALEVLLITSRRGRRWIVPKGLVEPDLSARHSAAKEALEEAGVEGRVGKRCLGTYEYEKWGGVCRVRVYPLQVLKQLRTWQEDFRKRRWFTPRDAVQRLDEEALGEVVEGFAVWMAKRT